MKNQTMKKIDSSGGRDVENNTAIPTNDHSETDFFPTRIDIFYDFNGSLGFAIGSSGFILAMYFENWLPYFRYGSLTWIWGCVFYSIPLLLKLKSKKDLDDSSNLEHPRSCDTSSFPWGIGDLGEFLCYLFYTIGCILGGFFDEERVENFLPAINHMFVYGSFSLALKPVYQLLLFLTTRKGDNYVTTGKSGDFSRIRTPDGSDDDNSSTSNGNTASKKCEGAAVTAAALPLKKINWDYFFELGAMIFFCAAGVFGGFPPHRYLALPGVYFWEVGSFFSVARSFHMLHRRKQGLKKEAILQRRKLSMEGVSSLRQHNRISNQ